ncbi:MAG TPA: glycosyltransferase family 4 protein [Candidatus Absconditabacterales bacterium]|nr:glycosyltransferase family 4 protein [Candidatus Absconditabacterales bacterium]
MFKINKLMKTILFVLDYYLPHRGGVENVFENIILRLQKKGYKVIVLTSRYGNDLKEYEELLDTKIYRVGKNRIQFMIKSISLGKRILKQKKIDIIHASTYGGAIPASILGKKLKIKVILTVHEIFGKLWFKYKGLFGGLVYKIFEKIIFMKKYDIYHCVSNNTAKELKENYKVDERKIKVIHNGIDDNFWNIKNVDSKEIFAVRKKYKRDDKFIFLYFGHAGKSKGIDYLIKALPEVLKLENVMVVFNIIESKRSKKILNKLRLLRTSQGQRNIQVFNGFSKKDLRNLVASCDCVIAPSISEGFGSVHTESVAMGKTIITTKTSAIPEVIWGKVKFIKPGSVSDIINATKDVLKGNYEKIPEKKFDWDKSVEKIEKLYFID